MTTDPGVYLMKDRREKVLYVGKAKNLKVRLKQYFVPGRDERPMIPFLTAQIEMIDTIVTFSEKDALLLENTLIKRHRPKYNILLKDDKAFVSLLINQRHTYPMIKIIRYREKPTEKGLLFGPYTSAFAARQTVELMEKLFKLRQCSDRELKSRSRPCLLYSINRCLAPCVSKCTLEAYQVEVKRAIAFLKGNNQQVIRTLKQEMESAAKHLEFEKAQKVLTMIKQVEHVTQEKQSIVKVRTKDRDALALHREEDRFLIAKLLFRQGKLIGAESYPIEKVVSDEKEVLEAFLLQHYSHQLIIPAEILLPSSLANAPLLEEILTDLKGKAVRLIAPQKGEKGDQLSLAQKNATTFFHQQWSKQATHEDLLLALQEVCSLINYPLRIECFDISNLGGSDPVASMVGFFKGVRDKKMTRLFTIKTAKGGDDYGSLHEALSRHYAKAKQEDALPDLIVIDGGKGHLQIASKVLAKLEIASVDFIALAKEGGKHDKGLREEQIFIPHHRDPILLSPRSPVLFLLQKIRDEAHRVALSFQRKRRQKRILKSSLEEIPGIGPKKRNRLLKHFGSPKRAARASREELKEKAKLTKRDIDNLYRNFPS